MEARDEQVVDGAAEPLARAGSDAALRPVFPAAVLATAVILLLCLAVRLGYQTSGQHSDLWDDARVYYNQGARLAGRIRACLGLPAAPLACRELVWGKSVAYELVLGFCLACRIDPLQFQAVLDTVSCALVMAMVARLAGRVPALAGGVAYVFYFPFVHAAGMTLSETVTIFLLVGGLACALIHLHRPGRFWPAFGLAILFSLLPLARQACLPLAIVPVACLVRLAWRRWRAGGEPAVRAPLLALCIGLVPAALCLIEAPRVLFGLYTRPKVQRNTVAALMRDYQGWMPDERWVLPVHTPRPVVYVMRHPVDSLVLLTRKAWLLNQEPYNLLAEGFLVTPARLRMAQRLLFYGAVVVFPLVLARWPGFASLLGYAAFTLTGLAASVVPEARYNVVIMPCFMLVAVLGAAEFVARIRRTGRLALPRLHLSGLASGAACAAIVLSSAGFAISSTQAAAAPRLRYLGTCALAAGLLGGLIWAVSRLAVSTDGAGRRLLRRFMPCYALGVVAAAFVSLGTEPLWAETTEVLRGSDGAAVRCVIRPDRARLACEPERMELLIDAKFHVFRPDGVECRINGQVIPADWESVFGCSELVRTSGVQREAYLARFLPARGEDGRSIPQWHVFRVPDEIKHAVWDAECWCVEFRPMPHQELVLAVDREQAGRPWTAPSVERSSLAKFLFDGDARLAEPLQPASLERACTATQAGQHRARARSLGARSRILVRCCTGGARSCF